MAKILQINTVVNTRSTGRIAEQIGLKVLDSGWDSYIAYGRFSAKSESKLVKIGGIFDVLYHMINTRIFDTHGFHSKYATKRFIKRIKEIDPDIIHLHNVHGYYVNVEELFEYFAKSKKIIVWTLHDCWSFTGHCAFFENVRCIKWKNECSRCPQKKSYPTSLFRDNSTNNFALKRRIFTSVDNLTLIPVSDWLSNTLEQSFLGNLNKRVIKNGIDLQVFKPVESTFRVDYSLERKILILGVASKWDDRKGLKDFEGLRDILDDRFVIVIVGIDNGHHLNKHPGFLCFERTESVNELARIYSASDIFFNPTYEDNYPTTNLEAIACGTPVITYDSGGSSESLDQYTGITVEKGNLEKTVEAVHRILSFERDLVLKNCRERASSLFDKEKAYEKYMSLYSKLLE